MDREAEIEIKIGPKTRATSMALVVLLVVLALVDFVVLKGTSAGGAQIDLKSDVPAVFELTEVGKPHLVKIKATRRVKGETKGRNVDYKLVGPNGTVIVDESEFVDRKTRYIRFTPYVAGPYTIHVSDDSTYVRGGSTNRTATVTVHANDRRILPSILPF